MTKNNTVAAIHGIFIALGLFLGGLSIGVAFYKAKTADRFVTVKGLAEREVDADLAIWPITFRVTDNDLISLQNEIDQQRQVIQQFLLDAEFNRDEISRSAPRIRDAQAENYGNQTIRYRYVADAVVTVRSSDVAKVRQTMEESGNLVSKGVVLSADSWQNPTEFLFTALNDIKPAMIEEATKNAREAAEKFAQDSGSNVGKIRNASQGFFSITDRDRNSPERKKVRVVTTIQYYLD